MTTINPTYNNTVLSGDCGNRVVFVNQANVAANLANIGDKVRLCRIPAGTRVDRITMINGDLDSGTTLTDKIGYEYMDGTGGDDDAFCASGATTRRSAVTAASPTIYELFPPVVVERDSFVTLTVVAAATGLAAAVDVHCKVEGECLGAK